MELFPEAELPRIEDTAEPGETFAAGSTPTQTGDWAMPLLVTPEE